MLILTIRTDKPEAEIGLYHDSQQLAYITWQAHRQLAETIHHQIKKLLADASYINQDIEGVAVFKGPGSFTGLRIGISVANALASSFKIPVVAQSGPDWLETATSRLIAGETDGVALPDYGSEVHITKPKK